jgi:hypothetical protein
VPAPDSGPTPDILQRARNRVDELIAAYERHPLPDEVEQALIAFAQREAKSSGLEGLPGIKASKLSSTDLDTEAQRHGEEVRKSAVSLAIKQALIPTE